MIGAAASFTPAMSAAAIAVVSTCNDAGTGSLRKAVASAASGDTIDLSGLPCSTITLTTGAITVGVADLTLHGAGDNATLIDANHTSRVFTHTGTGLLKLQDLTVKRGTVYVPDGVAFGGCIYSKGSVRLDHALVKYCVANSPANWTRCGVVMSQLCNRCADRIRNVL